MICPEQDLLGLFRSLALVTGLLTAPVSARQVSPSCNDTTRQPSILAGHYNQISTNCPQLTFTVAGQSLSTPASCPTGYTVYDQTVYRCEGTANDIDCDPQKVQVTVSVFTGGGCPNIAGLAAGAYTSWADVPMALQIALNCVPPKAPKNPTFDYSAQCRKCTTGTPVPVEGIGEAHSGADGLPYTLWLGDPTALVAPEVINPFVTAFDAAQDGTVDGLPAALRLARSAYSPLVGADVSAELFVEHIDAQGISEGRRVSRVSGRVLSDGRFDLTITESFNSDGEFVPVDTRLAYDGKMLYSLVQGAECGNVYARSYTHWDATFARIGRDVRPLYDWVRDPLRVPMFSGAVYTLAIDSSGNSVQQRIITLGNHSIVSDDHLLEFDGTRSVPLANRVYDGFGGSCAERFFSDHRVVADGVWRPWSVMDVVHTSLNPLGARVVTTLRVSRATPIAVDNLQLPTFVADQLWQVWR